MTVLPITTTEAIIGIISGIAGLIIMRKLMQLWGEW